MATIPKIPLVALLHDIRTCTYCNELPLGPRPVLSINGSAKILIIGQAPGTRVHATGISWNYPSGNRLRAWMGLEENNFIMQRILPLCLWAFVIRIEVNLVMYLLGAECAPKWYSQVLDQLSKVELTLLIGQYT